MTTLRLGHRGHRLPRCGETENSLSAFDRALAAGCDGLELDLRHTGDGRLVVHHDDAIARIPVAECSLRALRRLDPELATAEQVLRRYRRRAWLDLELKTVPAAGLLLPILRRWPPQRGFVVSSFDPAALLHLARVAGDLPLCLNLRRPCRVQRLRPIPVAWVAPHHAACTAWYVRRLRRAGYRVLVWTVNHPARMRFFARAGADAVVSDDPYLLVQTLRPSAPGEQTVPPPRHLLRG